MSPSTYIAAARGHLDLVLMNLRLAGEEGPPSMVLSAAIGLAEQCRHRLDQLRETETER